MDNDWFYEYFINEVKAIRKKCISTGSTTQSDWNQNNSKAADYVKNRPFYTGDPAETVLVEESTVAFVFVADEGHYAAEFGTTFEAIVGDTYKVSWDGTVYECTCEDFHGMPVIGNLSIAGVGSDTGEPFLMGVNNGVFIQILTQNTSASHTISISGTVTPVVKIDPKYIRDMYYTTDPVENVLVEENVVTFEDTGEGYYGARFASTFVPTVGETYKVSWDGSVYESTCVKHRNRLSIGNLSIAGSGSDTGEPFLIGRSNDGRITIVTQNTSSSHTISISGRTTQVVKIDEKYLPDTVATKSEVEFLESIANDARSTAIDARSTANNAKTAAENAQTTANTAKTTADAAKTTADAAKITADKAKTTADKALIVDPNGNITAPIIYMNNGAYQSLSLTSTDQKHQANFAVTESTGLQIWVARDGGLRSSTASNPSTVEFMSSGGTSMQLSGINALIMSPINSTKKFKITVDDAGTISATEVT